MGRFIPLSVAALLVSSVALSQSARAANLLQNGDFSGGNTGFTSGYTYTTGFLDSVPGDYAIGTNPVNFWSAGTGTSGSYGDHTTGTGQMLIFNGSPVANTVLWQETVTVTPNTDFDFSGWVSTFGKSGGSNQFFVDTHPADFNFKINGAAAGTFALPSPTNDGTWGQFNIPWNSGASTSAQIQIYVTRTDIPGNDATIDDLSFAAVPEPCTAAMLGVAGCALLVRRARRRM